MVKSSMVDNARDPYDLILLDLDMPIMNGYDACERILQFYQLLGDSITGKFRKHSDLIHQRSKMCIQNLTNQYKEMFNRVERLKEEEEKVQDGQASDRSHSN